MTAFTQLNIPRSTINSRPCFRRNNTWDGKGGGVPKPMAERKAAGFGILSVSQNRVPSRVSGFRRASAITLSPSTRGGERARNPWTVNSRRRSIQASGDHLSKARSICKAPAALTLSSLEVVETPASVVISKLSPPSSALETSVPQPIIRTLPRPFPSSEARRPSVTARAQRTPPTARYPQLQLRSSAEAYTMEVLLPSSILPEMVTITTARGDKLRIVADAWHLETDCHYEWEISFPPQDVDMKNIRAKFHPEGRLSVCAGRC